MFKSNNSKTSKRDKVMHNFSCLLMSLLRVFSVSTILTKLLSRSLSLPVYIERIEAGLFHHHSNTHLRNSEVIDTAKWPTQFQCLTNSFPSLCVCSTSAFFAALQVLL
uniref:Uncharacterized protein n=1 Tax=Kalanchoe fedtschenkoi TaxID=63787 RepID=A0A7N0U8Z6_KALFE